ncbi:hypothetical protein LTR05_005406 [Lithohypha guttulata]|uniref:Uncharacterized protein n=1 Tax=Lithohypha guttulata TaxID=1690604 RepID=A0AAN7YF82_9EURO|nr:hypothetical protein LTR05_005406 [Lithohypha guttulata]
MAQAAQATPTVRANLGGSTNTVNLRDWLNTRLSPFLKQAIIKSLESEAEYPLQWLGEQLILQSITFEGNPDSTNIRERFLYKHEPDARQSQTAASSTSDNTANADTVTQPPEASSVDVQPSVTEQPPQDTHTDALATSTVASNIDQIEPESTTVNGAAQAEGTDHSKDADMSNAP